jgi:hypothetical protein
MKRSDFKNDAELLAYLRDFFDSRQFPVHSVGGMYINNDAMVKGVKQLEESARKAQFAIAMGDNPQPFNALEKLGLELLMQAALL